MWLAYQVSLDYQLQTGKEKVKKELWKWQRKTRKLFLLDHCSSCRFKSCVDSFKVIYLTPRCEFVIKIPRGDTELEEDEEEMAASQVNVLSRVWGCVCSSSWNTWSEHLQTFNSLLSFLPRVFVANGLFFPVFVVLEKTGSLDCFFLMSQSLLSNVCILAFYRAWWILNIIPAVSMLNILPLRNTNTGRCWYKGFPVEYCSVLDPREVGEMPWWVYIWMHLQVFRTGAKGNALGNRVDSVVQILFKNKKCSWDYPVPLCQ